MSLENSVHSIMNEERTNHRKKKVQPLAFFPLGCSELHLLHLLQRNFHTIFSPVYAAFDALI